MFRMANPTSRTRFSTTAHTTVESSITTDMPRAVVVGRSDRQLAVAVVRDTGSVDPQRESIIAIRNTSKRRGDKNNRLTRKRRADVCRNI
jgi:hypothetical protein